MARWANWQDYKTPSKLDLIIILYKFNNVIRIKNDWKTKSPIKQNLILNQQKGHKIQIWTSLTEINNQFNK